MKITACALSLCLLILSACSSFTTYPAGNIQYEVFDRPAWLSNSVTIIGYCDAVDVDGNRLCRADVLSTPQIYVQTGVLPSIFGPFITAAGIATAGKFIGDGLADSGNTNSLSATNNQSVTQPGPWRGGYRHR